MQKKVEEWKYWSKQFVSNCLKIETINKKSRDSILAGMKNVDSEVSMSRNRDFRLVKLVNYVSKRLKMYKILYQYLNIYRVTQSVNLITYLEHLIKTENQKKNKIVRPFKREANQPIIPGN